MGTTTNIVDPSSTNGPDYVTLHEPDARLIAMLALSNSKPARPDKQRLTVFFSSGGTEIAGRWSVGIGNGGADGSQPAPEWDRLQPTRN